MLRINSFDRFDLQNAINQDKPAFTIWFQGCSAGCHNCQNPKLQEFDGGDQYTPDRVLEMIRQQSYGYDTVILLGGEPMEQDTGSLYYLITKLHSMGYNIWLYTGLEFKDIPEGIRMRLHFLKTGRYIESLRTEGFPASSNQEIHIRTHTGLVRVEEVPTHADWNVIKTGV